MVRTGLSGIQPCRKVAHPHACGQSILLSGLSLSGKAPGAGLLPTRQPRQLAGSALHSASERQSFRDEAESGGPPTSGKS